MPEYEICYLDDHGTLTYQFSANCGDDQRAKILAHAMKPANARAMEVWRGAVLVYRRPGEAVVTERPVRHSSWTGSP